MTPLRIFILINLSLQATTYFYNYAVVHFQEAFIYFGGGVDFHGDGTTSSVIAKFDSITRHWSILGNLLDGRHGHGVIFDGSYFLVAGGRNWSFQTEKCSLTESTITCQQQEPELDGNEEYPELFLVQDDFCKNT